MIVGLLSLQSRKEANPETASRLSVAARRVRAIARLHRHLHSMDRVPTVEFKPYLDRFCRDHSTMPMSEEQPDQVIAVEAIESRLPTVIGIPLSLIVNELVTNAIKHGKGRITAALVPAGKGHALSVSNEGSDLPEGFDPTACKGLGMTLVSSLAAQIGGELRIIAATRRLHEIYRAVRLNSPWSIVPCSGRSPRGRRAVPPAKAAQGEQSHPTVIVAANLRRAINDGHMPRASARRRADRPCWPGHQAWPRPSPEGLWSWQSSVAVPTARINKGRLAARR